MAGLALDGTGNQTDGDEADPPTETIGFLKGMRYRELPVRSARFPANPNETRAQRCGKPGRLPDPPAVYGELLPFRVRGGMRVEKKCYWLCRDCYT